jgi:hypothetical protein
VVAVSLHQILEAGNPQPGKHKYLQCLVVFV